MPVVLVGFVPLAAAALAALMAVGVYLLVRAIANSLPSLSLPFGISIKPGDWFQAIVSPVVGWIVHGAESAFHFVAHLIYGHAWLIEQFAQQAVAAVGHLGEQIAHIVNTAIPDAVRAAEHDVARAVNSLERTIARDATRAADDLAHDISKVARSVYTSERGIVSELDHAIKSAVSTGVNEAVSEADRAIADLRSYVDQRVGEADRAIADAEAIAKGAVADVGRLADRVDVNTGDIAKLLALVGGISVAGVLARVATIEGCYVRTCEPSSPQNLLNLLKGLGLLAEFAGVGAFLTEVVDDPAAAAQDYGGVIQGIFSEGQSVFEDVLNLA